MTVSQIMEKMISFSKGNIHDIDHFLRVWSYAKTIGELEQLDSETQFIAEADYIANASENNYSKQNIQNFADKIMKTDTGKRICSEVFSL